MMRFNLSEKYRLPSKPSMGIILFLKEIDNFEKGIKHKIDSEYIHSWRRLEDYSADEHKYEALYSFFFRGIPCVYTVPKYLKLGIDISLVSPGGTTFALMCNKYFTYPDKIAGSAELYRTEPEKFKREMRLVAVRLTSLGF